MSNTDRIEKQVILNAPRERVWRAIANADEFGTWFGAELDAPFVAGTMVPVRIVPTRVDPEVAKKQEPYAGAAFRIWIERVEPMSRLSFRWHSYEPEGEGDSAGAPTTLVEFVLEDHPEGTLLTITESGFDRIPLAKRAEAFASNKEGWTIQATLIARYLARAT
jgi:uncharacterized protein YndB with AHSA1/START domain